MDGRSLRDIGLTERILNKLLELAFPSRAFFSRSHILDEEMEHGIKDEDQSEQENQSTHAGEPSSRMGYFFHALILREAVEKFPDRSSEHGMKKSQIDLGQRDEDELTFMESGMGDFKSFSANLHLIIEKDIEVDRPGSPREGLDPPHPGFNGFQCLEETGRAEVRFNLYHSIDEPILLGIADGSGFIKGGLGQERVAVNLQDFRNGFFTATGLVPEVGTDPDVDNMFHGAKRKGPLNLSFFFRDLFRFFGSHVDFILILVLGRFLKIPDPLSKTFPNLREFSGSENHEDDDQDDQQLRHSNSEHTHLL